MMSLDSGQLHPKIVITPSTIQQEKATAAASNSEALATNTVANGATAAEATDFGLKKDQEPPPLPTCSVENEAGLPSSTTLIIPSSDAKVSS